MRPSPLSLADRHAGDDQHLPRRRACGSRCRTRSRKLRRGTGVPAAPVVGHARHRALRLRSPTRAERGDQQRLAAPDHRRRQRAGSGPAEVSADQGAPAVRRSCLFTQDPAHFYVAQSGWVSAQGAAPNHESGFVPENGAGAVTLAPGAAEVSVPFIWKGPDGVTIRRTYTLKRNDYAVDVRDEVVNTGSGAVAGHGLPPAAAPAAGDQDRHDQPGILQLQRRHLVQHAEAVRAPEVRRDYMDDGKLDQSATGSWIAMLQHHFFSAWIPDPKTAGQHCRPTNCPAARLIREIGPGVNVAPGQQATTDARLYVGPKLIDQMKAQGVPACTARSTTASSRSSIASARACSGCSATCIRFRQLGLVDHRPGGAGEAGAVSAGQQAVRERQQDARSWQPRIAQLKERYGDDRPSSRPR